MRIKKLHLYPVSLVVNPDFVITTTLGTHAFSKYVFVGLESVDGTIGWGEATVVPQWSGETQAGALAIIREYFEPLLIGRDATDYDSIMQEIELMVIDNIFAKAAIEMALLDLVGKGTGQPVYKILGGNSNPHKIPIKFSIGLREPEDAAEIARQKVNSGFKAIKVKVSHDLEKDVARVRQVREAIGPDVLLNIDVNGGWGVKESIRNIPKFCEFDLEYVEQPTARWDIDGMAEVRAKTDVPIMADETVFTVEQAMQVICKHAADLISVYPGKNGGMLNSRLICKMAESAGIACHIGSNLEWDIATSAMCHLAVSTTNIQVNEFPVDILGPLYYTTRLPGCPVLFKDGYVHLPEGPGLGLDFDASVIEELSHGIASSPPVMAQA